MLLFWPFLFIDLHGVLCAWTIPVCPGYNYIFHSLFGQSCLFPSKGLNKKKKTFYFEMFKFTEGYKCRTERSCVPFPKFPAAVMSHITIARCQNQDADRGTKCAYASV